MRSTWVAVVALLLAGAVRAQVATPSAGPNAGDLQGVLRDYVGELQTSLPPLQQRLKDEEASLRQFEQYLRRMRSDAAVQRTFLALGNMRAPALAQALRNWQGWETIARDHLGSASALAADTDQSRQDEEDRWTLLGDQSQQLAATLGNVYAEAKALHEKKLELLSRLQGLAQRHVKDAKAAVGICDDVEAAIRQTVERQHQRFLWTRVGLAKLPSTLTETGGDLALMVAPFTTASWQDWAQLIREVVLANWVAVLTGLVLLVVVLWRSRVLKSYLGGAKAAAQKRGPPHGRPQRFVAALLAAFGRSLVTGAIAAAAVLIRLGLGDRTPPWSQPLLSLAMALFVWRLVYALVGTTLDPARPEYRLTAMDDRAAAWWRQRLRRVVLWLLWATVNASLVERSGLTSPSLVLAFVVIELLALRSVTSVLHDERLAAARVRAAVAVWGRRFRQLARAGMLLMIALSGFGFLNLAWYVGWGLLKSVVVLALAAVLWRLGEDVLAQWDSGLSLAVRRSAAAAWTSLIAALVVVVMPFAWGIEGSLWGLLQRVLGFGIAVGTRQLTVLRLVVAALCLIGAWLFGRLLGVALERRVFPRTPIDVGVRTAIVRSIGYVLITIGALAAVRTLGFDLTNLAIMAGALGVGIGFGLQTLVSNFVSGLIILFERPFKIGDILEQDGVYGYVRRIRARSTVLRTFDESEIVLPNADLLSHKITNWTLTDNRARVTVSVGVAYGSDVVKVRETLYRVGKEHPRVLAEPQVYFTNFGDSSLDFRLMVWIDIRERLKVLSDLHFAVDAAFREAGIQIPFPQRDVHFFPKG